MGNTDEKFQRILENVIKLHEIRALLHSGPYFPGLFEYPVRGLSDLPQFRTGAEQIQLMIDNGKKPRITPLLSAIDQRYGAIPAKSGSKMPWICLESESILFRDEMPRLSSPHRHDISAPRDGMAGGISDRIIPTQRPILGEGR